MELEPPHKHADIIQSSSQNPQNLVNEGDDPAPKASPKPFDHDDDSYRGIESLCAEFKSGWHSTGLGKESWYLVLVSIKLGYFIPP